MNCIIIDDEETERIHLHSLLDEIGEIVVVGEAEDCQSALTLFKAHADVDLLLLDIELPDGTGFDLISQLENPPKVIFITNHEAYALRAFEINAIDYIQKPLTRARLKSALERLERTPSAPPVDIKALHPDDLILLNSDNRKYFIKVSDIIAIESDQNYTQVIRAGGQRIMIKKTLSAWDEQLPNTLFRRLGRGLIINMEAIDRLETKPDENALWLKQLPTPLALNRAEFKKIQQLAKSV